jgi:hypothetical protein
MTEKLRICVNCQHYEEFGDNYSSQCNALAVKHVNVVTGNSYRHITRNAKYMRESGGQCDVEGKLFLAKLNWLDKLMKAWNEK